MAKREKVCVIMPAYNEADAIGKVLDRLMPMAKGIVRFNTVFTPEIRSVTQFHAVIKDFKVNRVFGSPGNGYIIVAAGLEHVG